jgi:hypothetical protein
VASFTITAAPWPAGTSVGVYDARSWMNTAAAPPGAPLGGGVVTLAGTVAFTGLADNTRYVAFADGLGVRFATAVPGLHQSVAVPDRERIKLLEDQVAAGGGGGGGGTGGLDLYTVDTNEHFKVIGLSNGTVTAIPFDVQPPTVPTGLVAAVKVTSVRLDWNGVAGAARYPIARDGVQIAAPEVRNYRDTTVTIGSTHAYQVATEDAYGQRSGYGPAVSVHRPGLEHRADDRDPDVAARHPDQRDGAAARQRDRHGRRDARARPLHRPRKPRPHG